LDLSDDTGKARKLAYYDNRAGQVGLDWDAEVLLADLQSGVDMSNLFDQSELDAMLAGLQPPNVEFKEYNESVADDVEMITCPHCGQQFPK
jgi:hypothetical protein